MSTRQLALGFEHRPGLAMDDFLIASGNREAVAWLDRWPDWPAPALAIHGPAGSGKTHLAHLFRIQSGAVLLDGAALGEALPPALLGPARALVVEHAERAAGIAERTLLHLYNLVAERRGHMLLTGRAPPARWPVRLADLASRLAAIPTARLAEPDDVLISAVLVKMFADRQLRVAPALVDYLVNHMERSFAAAGAVVAALDAAALAEHRNITLPLVRRVLAAEGLDN